MRRRGENRRDRRAVGAAEAVPVERDIARRLGPELRRLRQHRGGDIGHRIARLVIDRDKFGGVARDRLALGDDERHGLAGMADAVAGQRRTMRHDQPGAVRDRAGEGHVADAGLRHVGGGQHRQHARQRPRRARIDAADGGEGVRRAHEHGMRLTGDAVVVAETARRRSADGGPRRAARTAGSSGLPPASAAVGFVSLPQPPARASGKSKRPVRDHAGPGAASL